MQHSLDQGAADIIIPVHNGFCHTRTLLEGIYRYTDCAFRICIIDNASTDETVDLHKIYSRDITIVRNRERCSWGEAIRQGAQLGTGPFLVLMSNGVEVAQGWLGNMIAFLNTHPRIAAVGPLDSNRQDWQCVDRVRESMVPQIPRFFTDDIHERNRILHYHFQRTGILIDEPLGFFCTVLRRRAVNDVGLPGNAKSNGASAAFCRRLRKAGYVLGITLDTYVLRHEVGDGTRGPRRARGRKAGAAGAIR